MAKNKIKRNKKKTENSVGPISTKNKLSPAVIKVVGIGGGGGNAISRMRDKFAVRGVDFIAINTDSQDLDCCNVHRKIYIGKNLTRGLGTGMNPELGRQAAEENRSEIAEALQGADLVFITAGLGGGTGSGASPVVAETARELGALTVSVVTKPFSFEGSQRSRIAEEAGVKLKEKSDTVITIPNDRIFSIIQKDTPLLKAFERIDDVLRYAVQGIAELIAAPGIINVDFADVRTIMESAGSAIVGIGIASGQERAMSAVDQAITSPLLETSIEGARGVLFAVSGGRDLRLNEINDIAKIINSAVDPDAKIIFGAYHDRRLSKGQIKIVLVATGFSGTLFKGPDKKAVTLFPASLEKNESAVRVPVAEGVLPQVQELKMDKKAKDGPAKKKTEDIWDIPTFLRKRKK